jgi:aminopeptidase
MAYTPPQELLTRYADLLVNFGLGGADGLAPGSVVWVNAPENTKPLFVEVCRAVWRAGGHLIREYDPADDDRYNLSKDFYELASDEQLDFFPAEYWRGLLDQSDYVLQITSSTDPHALEGVPSEKIMRRHETFMPVVEWQLAKEAEDRFSFTIGLYGTDARAAEAGLSIEEYWDQIIAACYLDEAEPVARWRELDAQISAQCQFLSELPIDRLHLEGEDADLWLTLGEHRKWIGGGGRNIPSFEVFTCPDWRGTEGWIRFNEPLYIYGSLIRGTRLEFREGRVVSATADENQELLEQMIGAEGADKIGEFSLTDARLSRITHFMASTLYDENTGGEFGNTHLAVGLGVRHAYDGDMATVSEEEWDRLGFNVSTVHTDIVSTTDRTVTALLRDGSERVIYAGGQFQSGD